MSNTNKIKFQLLFIIVFFFTSTISFSQASKVKIEIPFYLNNGFINLPGALDPPISKATSGWGRDIGAGLNVTIRNPFFIRFGYHNWTMQLNTDIEATHNNQEIRISENGTFMHNGIYTFLGIRKNNFFIQGGFDLSFNHSYSCDQTVYVNDAKQDVFNNQKNSLLTDDFNTLFHLFGGIGGIIPLNNSFNLILNLNWAFLSNGIYDSGVESYGPKLNSKAFGEKIEWESSEVKMTFLSTFKFGVILQYNIFTEDAPLNNL